MSATFEPMEFGFDVPNMHQGLGLEAYVGGAEIKRDPDAFRFVNQVRFQLIDGDGPDTDDCIGRPARVASLMRTFAEVGVDHLQLKPAPGPTTDSMIEQADRFAEQIVPLIGDLFTPAPHFRQEAPAATKAESHRDANASSANTAAPWSSSSPPN